MSNVNHELAKCGYECIRLKDHCNQKDKEIAHLKTAIIRQNKDTSSMMDELTFWKKKAIKFQEKLDRLKVSITKEEVRRRAS